MATGEDQPHGTATAYSGDGAELFQLAMATGALSFVTLGIYRFWSKTRIRGYIWSHTRLDGHALEYTGTGLEKLLGFLAAVVVLAVYLAAVQLGLFLLGMRFVMRPETAAQALAQVAIIYSTFLAIVPLMFFAKYRSRRYRLARTRFRGIRFGMTSDAWGYTWRALLYLVPVFLTLGLLQPLMRFRLEQFMTERTWFGNARMEQRGSWRGLFGAMKHALIGGGLVATAFVAGAMQVPALAAVCGVLGFVWLPVGIVSYWVQGFGYLTRNKAVVVGAEAVTFRAAPRTATIIKHYLLGWLAVGAIAAMVGGMGAQLVVQIGQEVASPLALPVLGGLAYVGFLTFLAAVQLPLIQQPIIGHFIGQTVVVNAQALASVRQRGGEAGADADGFAEALDVGGAF